MNAPLNLTNRTVEPPLLAGLIRTEISEWMQQLTGSYEQLAKLATEGKIRIGSEATLNFAKAKAQTEVLRQKMDLLVHLAESYTDDQTDNRERLQLADLVASVINPGGPLGHLGNRFELPVTTEKFGPIYGNREWLETALIHLLTELHKGTPRGRRIVLNVKQLGNFQLLVTRDELMPRSESSQASSAQVVRELPKLSFSFCRRIIDLHGGTLKLETEKDKDMLLIGFTLSLPTGDGTPTQARACITCPLTAQVERYAEDLAVLMERCYELESKGEHHG